MSKNKIFRFCYALTLVVVLVSSVVLFFRIKEERNSDAFYEQMLERAEKSLTFSKDDSLDFSESTPSRLVQMAADYPNIAAWIQIPDTSIDYPVMLGEDNQFYLSHLPDGSKNTLGSLFFDYRSEENSPHLIIYGHNAANGTLFGLLKQYESLEYLKKHPEIIFETEDTKYFCPIFSVRRISIDDVTYTLEINNQDELQNYIEQAGQQSMHPIEVPSAKEARILTLSTCTRGDDERLVVQALLIE